MKQTLSKNQKSMLPENEIRVMKKLPVNAGSKNLPVAQRFLSIAIDQLWLVQQIIPVPYKHCQRVQYLMGCYAQDFLEAS